MDRKHPLSHGEKRLQHEDVNNEKTNTGKILRKSTFTVHDFDNRDQENSGCREQDNPDGLQNREKREPVNVFKNMLSVEKENLQKSKNENVKSNIKVSQKHIPVEKIITMQLIDNGICKQPRIIEDNKDLKSFQHYQELENKKLGRAYLGQQMVRL